MTHYPAHSKIYHIKSDSLDNSKINKETEEQHSTDKKPKILNKMSENSNSLSGLLEQYDSDSDYENVNGQESIKLDAKVDNFLQEINQLVAVDVPEQKSIQKHIETLTCAWQECYDESTGYPYYWNVGSNAVTWEMPQEYKLWITQIETDTKHPIANVVENRNLSTEKQVPVVINAQLSKTREKKKKDIKKVFREPNSSDDEKIVMITSFSEGSSSESENEKHTVIHKQIDTIKVASPPRTKMIMGPHIEDIPKEPAVVETKKEIIENIKDENIDETVILARLRTQAKVLHELGGELPKSVDKNILTEKLENNIPQSLCLVAGYGDDSDHSDVDEESVFKKSIFPIPEIQETNEIETKESTLFPATVTIDVKQFELPNNMKQVVETKDINEELIDNKAFKRKKRLGLAFDVKPDKRIKVDEIEDFQLGENRKGFGFQTTNDNDDSFNKTNNVNFKKGGITFIKSDILNSNDSNSELKISDKVEEDFKEIKNIVTEKVNFLGEGKDPVSAVQIMSIQLQTLEAAYNVQALTKSYLYSWLRETFAGLEKLEQEAAPEGWTCQWDRSNKRYFYRNTASGETQWHYPEVDTVQLDIVGGGEAMDICTTPPPNEDIQQPEVTTRKGSERVLTPSPPRIQNSPSPPPPPSIISTSSDAQPPIPSVPPPDEVIPPPPPTITENQPLPPGVDSPDLPYFAAKLKEKESSSSSTNTNEIEKDSLVVELDSFYSDIAQLEATHGAISEIFENKSVSSSSSIGENPTAEIVVKKKKKSKPKLGQGINMKKKAVSSLVEKWKKVQNDY